ncbi:hemerythrin domain-containing protein [Clostridium sp. SHJSY1]|uniref:hemerythrin domain-containing protein n=1 Tax=Clostridium sp. SHJSY1 TaxID=2942483 RepID=UPI002876DFEB|nr:hemerythrin domain-containing protein [Clostridium sp. SHJSY1]MDS0524368.1 hemerythrin domain-containing protein [Clostridium sp. SHJSY1]
MNALELMIDEHKYIKRMLLVVRKVCYKIVEGEDVNYEDFYSIIDFIRNFADKHHHGKEEQLLFNRMVDEIGLTAEKLVKHGMLVEHDLGRLYISELCTALESLKTGNDEAKIDIIGSAISYTNLLTRHIDKEDGVVYKFAEKQLSSETLLQINNQCEIFEEENSGDREKYINILEKLEIKYS